MTVVLVWEFDVEPGREAEFVRAYRPEGDWAVLFRQADGFRGTELLRDEKDPTRYVTIDRWESLAAWEDFRRRFKAEYEALDARCEALTSRESRIGTFEVAS
ncbi:MAG TPA: antibiotic biosynthesis monooxygenase family protein [Vicinamibacteria bacterium]|nr:antibiotic biosynthesis monooxygenase family protein [Vicinamibacteria bacterium]